MFQVCDLDLTRIYRLELPTGVVAGVVERTVRLLGEAVGDMIDSIDRHLRGLQALPDGVDRERASPFLAGKSLLGDRRPYFIPLDDGRGGIETLDYAVLVAQQAR